MPNAKRTAMDMLQKKTPEECIKRFNTLKSKRATWETLWQSAADYTQPNRNDITSEKYPGERRNIQLLDNTGIMSAELLASNLHSTLTNPNIEWFELTTGNPDIDDLDEVRTWRQEVTTLIHHVINNSNFQTEVHQLYLDEITIGTGPMSIEDDDDMVVRFSSRHIREVVVAENNKGAIDELYRKFCWNTKQILQEFGEENLPKEVLEAINKKPDSDFDIIHAIYPRSKTNGKSPKAYKFASCYIFVQTKTEISEGGFREFPYVVPRWTKSSGEIYGRSPAMIALPDCKVLNSMTESVLKGAQKASDPPVQIPDDGFVLPLVTKPGGVNYYRAGSTDRVEAIFNDTRVDFGFEAVNERRARIREAFYADKLTLQQGPQMTATEVLQRIEEVTRLLGPVLGRQQSEFLRPMIDRVFEIMARKGLIPEAPEAIQGSVIDVQYSSVIARSQRATVGQNILKTMEAATPFINLDPSVKDLINGEEIFKILAKVYGFPQKGLRNVEDIKKIREAKAAAEAEAAEAIRNQNSADIAAKAGPVALKAQEMQREVA